MALGTAGFSVPGHDPMLTIDAEDAEGGGLLQAHGTRGHRDVGARFQVEGQHLADVHPVDVVGAEDGHDVRGEVVDQVQVLQHGIGRAPVPRLARPLLRGHHRDEGVGEDARRAPGHAQVLDEALRSVLHEHVHREEPGVDEVGDDEVDDAVAPPERAPTAWSARG